MQELEKLLQKLGIKFSDRNVLQKAFIHRSYLNEIKGELESNERLEFLGDSILSFIISSYLYTKRPKDPEGMLTNLRSYIVKTKSLAEAAGNLKLGEYLKLSKGEDISGGRNNPQLLANTYEALIGAIYLDQGLEKTEDFIMETLIPFFTKEVESGPPKDAKSFLQELVQEEQKQSPQYKIVKTFGPDHAKQFVIGVFIKGDKVGQGQGTSKQEAEEKAASEALGTLSK